MYEYLATATDSGGKRTTHRVEAASASEAHAQLTSQGFSEITMHTDDAAAAAPRAREYDRSLVTPRDAVELQFISGWGYFLFLLKRLTAKVIVLQLAALAYLAYRVFTSQSLGVGGAWAIGILLLPLAIASYTAIFSVKHKHHAMLDAYTWGRWDEVLTRTEALRGRVSAFELDGRAAGALAGLGKLEAALDRMRPYEAADQPPRWMYLTFLGEIHERAERYDEALHCHEQAYRAAPANPTVEIDYALALLKRDTNTELAGQLIASAEAKPLSDFLQRFLPYPKGLLYLNSGKEALALEAFDQARAKLAPLSVASPPLHQFLDEIAAYEAIALARMGRRSEAMETAQVAFARLQKTDSRLLIQLETALGIKDGKAAPGRTD